MDSRPVAPVPLHRRLGLRASERLRAGREQPLGQLVVVLMLTSFALATWRTVPLGQLAALAAALVVVSQLRHGLGRLARQRAGGWSSLVCALVVPAMLGVGVLHHSFSPAAWAADGFFRPRHLLVRWVLGHQDELRTRAALRASLGEPDRVLPGGGGATWTWSLSHSSMQGHELTCWVSAGGHAGPFRLVAP